MTSQAQVRVLGPSRALLAIATGALVAVTSGATAFVVLSGGPGVVATSPSLVPLPPAAAPPGEAPFVVLPPGALGAPAPAAPDRDGAHTPARGSSPLVIAAPAVRVILPTIPGRPDAVPTVPALGPVRAPAPLPVLPAEPPAVAPRAPQPVAEPTSPRGHAAPEKAEKPARAERRAKADKPVRAEKPAEKPAKAEQPTDKQSEQKQSAEKQPKQKSGSRDDKDDRPARHRGVQA